MQTLAAEACRAKGCSGFPQAKREALLAQRHVQKQKAKGRGAKLKGRDAPARLPKDVAAQYIA
ncbi:hypothetical protein [Rhizobium sp. N122]|uniref:hypothetical protein n=1 Tax=Rhizobium sp. N122 TaxID=1764272 RepID=UPI00117A041C|nr:hypothetical protein [Rhizobium sp. N122]